MGEDKVTFCRVCEAFCGLIATVEDGRVTRLRPDPKHVLSRGYACSKGLAFHHVTHDPDRVLHPLKKRDGTWEPITWDAAIAEIAAKLNGIRERHGPHAIGFYTGNPSTFSYSTRLFAAAFIGATGTRNAYSAGTQDNSADFLASRFLYGAYLLQPIPDIDHTDHLLLVGVNPIVSNGTLVHAVDIRKRLKAVQARGGKIVVIDPRRSETARMASEHYFVRPDSDVFLLLAMLHVILSDGLQDQRFLDEHTSDAGELRRVVEPFTPELAARETGIDAATIRRLAHEFAGARRACSYGRAVCGTFGTMTAWALDVLNVVTGNLDRQGGAIFAGGLLDMVAITSGIGMDQYGHRRSRVGNHPACLGALPSGVLVDEITTPGPEQIRALVVTAGNPVLSIPRGDELAQAMQALECVVAIDFYMSETAKLAHYFLPATTFLEREDLPLAHQNLMLEPFVQWTEAVIPPLGEARHEWEIFSALAEAMGLPFLNRPLLERLRKLMRLGGRKLSASHVADLMIRTGPLGDKLLPWRDGLRLATIRKHAHGLRLPDNRTGVLREKIRHAGGKIRLRNEHLEAELRRLSARTAQGRGDGWLQLIGRRDQRSHNSWMHNVGRLRRGNHCDLRMHPSDAARLNVATGERVRLTSRVGAVEVTVAVTDEVMPGVVCMPHGWGHDGAVGQIASAEPGVNCNVLADRHVIEPLSGMSYLNGFPVRVEKLA
jgi:anaerobic selenocysteine-containing dehydrogenase